GYARRFFKRFTPGFLVSLLAPCFFFTALGGFLLRIKFRFYLELLGFRWRFLDFLGYLGGSLALGLGLSQGLFFFSTFFLSFLPCVSFLLSLTRSFIGSLLGFTQNFRLALFNSRLFGLNHFRIDYILFLVRIKLLFNKGSFLAHFYINNRAAFAPNGACCG